jgi:hypothetical protein
MAIEKTIFAETDFAANLEEVYTWLQANASDLFESITFSDSITCAVGGTTAVVIGYNSNYPHIFIDLHTKNNIVYSTVNNQQNMVATHAYKTSKGIAIQLSVPSSPTEWRSTAWLFVFRTSGGNVGAVLNGSMIENNSLFIRGCDFAKDIVLPELATGSVTTTIINIGMTLTSLCPLPLGNGGTSPDGLFLVPYTEMSTRGWQNLIIDIVGKKYVYNGILAFEE